MYYYLVVRTNSVSKEKLLKKFNKKIINLRGKEWCFCKLLDEICFTWRSGQHLFKSHLGSL